ncbi:putative membrane protein (plasmid) [Anoxybacillus sp. B7M1]|uniref:hypothetical protein n=1 Tax=Anoxybacillus sp. B7M1 TaxID=1490057 RepID=UPI0005CD89FA|nr:hypothetical protein [Anoxybacillus sp. B7M1]ANB66122.1 putative membrane protein [Anoxybacillus sp. B7M1]
MRWGTLAFLTSLITAILCVFCAVINLIIADAVGDSTNYKINPYIYYWEVLSGVFFYATIATAIILFMTKKNSKNRERA